MSLSVYDTAYRDLVQGHDEVRVGPVVIRISVRADGKHVVGVLVGDDEMPGALGFRWRDEAVQGRGGAMQAVQTASDILAGKTTEAHLRRAAATKKGWLKRHFEFFADHYDDIRGRASR